jgi:nucleotide-binding universal stress UspA family protein
MRIIVGVDGSTASKWAVRWAAHEARRRTAEVLIVSCYPALALASPYGAVRRAAAEVELLEAEAQRLADTARAEIRTIETSIVVTVRTTMSPPITGLIESVSAADEIVVGASGSNGPLDGLLGSVSNGLIHRAHVPVIVVPPKSPTSDEMRRIVVGVDGSPVSLGAMQWAYDEAERSGASLTVLHAWLYPYSSELTPTSEMHRQMLIDATHELQASVDELGAKLTDGSVQVEPVVSEHSPAEALLTEAATADLLVVGSRGRGGLRTLLLGSVSRTVVQHCPCPVAVIRPASGGEHDRVRRPVDRPDIRVLDG